MKDCPCKNCDERSSGCHSVCEDYKAFDARCKELRKRRQDEYQSSYFSKNAEKIMRKRKERH